MEAGQNSTRCDGPGAVDGSQAELAATGLGLQVEAEQNSMQPGLGLQLDSGQSWLQRAWGCSWRSSRAHCNQAWGCRWTRVRARCNRFGGAGEGQVELAATDPGLHLNAGQNALQPAWGSAQAAWGRRTSKAAGSRAAASRATAAGPWRLGRGRAGPRRPSSSPPRARARNLPGTYAAPRATAPPPPTAPLTASGARRPSPPCCTAASFLPSFSLSVSPSSRHLRRGLLSPSDRGLLPRLPAPSRAPRPTASGRGQTSAARSRSGHPPEVRDWFAARERRDVAAVD